MPDSSSLRRSILRVVKESDANQSIAKTAMASAPYAHHLLYHGAEMLTGRLHSENSDGILLSVAFIRST